MSLNWQWKERIGSCTYVNGSKSFLYVGNAFLIALNEWEENGKNLYSLAWFAADKKHMENQLGLTKEWKKNSFNDFQITEFCLNTKYKETAQFIQLLAKAKANVKIQLYNDIPPWEK